MPGFGNVPLPFPNKTINCAAAHEAMALVTGKYSYPQRRISCVPKVSWGLPLRLALHCSSLQDLIHFSLQSLNTSRAGPWIWWQLDGTGTDPMAGKPPPSDREPFSWSIFGNSLYISQQAKELLHHHAGKISIQHKRKELFVNNLLRAPSLPPTRREIELKI